MSAHNEARIMEAYRDDTRFIVILGDIRISSKLVNAERADERKNAQSRVNECITAGEAPSNEI